MFKLLRHFSLASLLSMTAAAVVLGLLYRHIAMQNLLELGEKNNVVLALALSNTLLPDFEPLLSAGVAAPGAANAERLAARVVQATRGLSVVKIKIYNPRGVTVFSSEANQVGEDKLGNAGFQRAAGGRAASELTHRDKFSAFEQTIQNRDLISSYVPVYRGQQQQVLAVFEVYDDVTPLLAQLSTTQAQVVVGVVMVLAALYAVLFFVVRRADTILHAQHEELSHREGALERAANLLEQRVQHRTQALEDLNANLKGEIQQRRAVEQELTGARREAEAASAAKSQFLSSMSHEIRTPLNGVLGMAELLQQTRLDGEQARYVGAITASGRALHGLLGDILDLSKIEEGQVQLEHIDFDLQELLAETADVYRELASTRGLVLRAQLQACAGRVNGDPGRLRQVLSNLLGNAIKFTERGEVRLQVQTLPAPPGDGRSWQRFTVEDDGPGIAPLALARLFQRFVQADISTTREYGGSGLGLVICRRLVELMGGTIQVHSEPGKGSRFWFDLPLATPTQALAAPRRVAKAVTPIHARVLVAEDNQVNQQVIRGLLGHLGVQVTLVDNGALALQHVQEEAFDLVFMDCQMPLMDGFEATRRIRAWESSQGAHSPLPVIALTANALSGDREACLAAGMNDYVAKPITMASLGKVLRSYLNLQDNQDKPDNAGAPDSVLPAMLHQPAAPDFDPTVLAALPMVADGSEPEFAQHILGMFTDSAPATLDAIAQAVLQGDHATLTRLVHTLKSSAAQIGAAALAQEAARQEKLLRAGSTSGADFPDRLRHAFAQFQSALARPEYAAIAPTGLT